jgi:hypothetical protein
MCWRTRFATRSPISPRCRWAELETLAQLLAQELAVQGVLAIDALDDSTAATIAETGLRDDTVLSVEPGPVMEPRRETPNGGAVKAALREFAAE